jgi:hypothetical protein
VAVSALVFPLVSHSTSSDQWERTLSYEAASSMEDASGHGDHFGRHTGDYRAAWETQIGNAPAWVRPYLRQRIFGSPEFQDLERYEARLADTGHTITEAEENVLNGQAHSAHINLVIHLRHWIGNTSNFDTYGENGNAYWSADNVRLMDHYEEHMAPWGDRWGYLLLGYSTAFLALGFGLSAAGGFAWLVAKNAKSRHSAGMVAQKLLASLAQGYSEGCRAIHIEPSSEILSAIKQGRLDLALALTPQSAVAALCEEELIPQGVLYDLKKRLPPEEEPLPQELDEAEVVAAPAVRYGER